MMTNAVTILGVNPTVADIADCIKCAATLPGEWPAMPMAVPDAVFRYRLCKPCVRRYLASSDEEAARWRCEFYERLELISEQMLSNAHAIMAPDAQETVQ
jgi:hypothetical protein